ncbi:MAG: glycine-rich protein, partial [Candidatus Cybelea sp.]
MIDFRLGRYAVGVCAAVALLEGCGGAASSGVVPIAAPDHFPKHKPFYFTGRAQDFRVPEGVTHITVVARGAHGAGSPAVDGGRVHAVIPVTPGEKLVIYVGGDASGTTAGFNGGGSGGPGGHGYKTADGYGGGGASDVREGGKLSDRIVVAGGGGGNGGATSGYD